MGNCCLLWLNTSIKILISAFCGGIIRRLLLQSCLSLRLLQREKGETRYLFRNLWSLTPHYLTAESLQAARRPVSLRRFVTRGLAGLHPFSDSLAECLRHWRDCQSYLSQLCLAIRLAAPSVAFFSAVHNKWCQFNLSFILFIQLFPPSGWMFGESFPDTGGPQRSTLTWRPPAALSQSEHCTCTVTSMNSFWWVQHSVNVT